MHLYFFVIMSYVIGGYAADYKPILFQILNETNDCNHDELFANFDLSVVPQFGAMCNVLSPHQDQVEFLLENDAVPILCMGIFDVSLRLCKLALGKVQEKHVVSEDSLSKDVFTDVFPPSIEKFNIIFDNLSKLDDFSSVEMFCSSTVNNFKIVEASSNNTQFWWSVLNDQFSNKNNCMSICRTYEKNKVNPLCSYIVWSNKICIDYNRSKEDIGLLPTDKNSGLVDTNLNQQGSSSLEQTMATDKEVIIDPIPAEGDKVLTSNLGVVMEITEQTNTATVSNKNSSVNIVQQPETDGQMISVQKHLDPNSDAKTQGDNVKPSRKGKKKGLKKPMTKVDNSEKTINVGAKESMKTIVNNKPTMDPKGDVMAVNPINQSDDIDVKTQIGANGHVVIEDNVILKEPKDQKVDNPKSNDETVNNPKSKDEATNNDENFTFEDQEGDLKPSAIDDPQLPVPDAVDEDTQDGDGDDVETEEESLVKMASNNGSEIKPKPSKPNLVKTDQGSVDSSNGVYGEILIEDHFIEAEDSHFFTYFLCMAVLTIMAYLAFHNKKKLIALAVEGRRTKGTRRRPNSSNYSKLDCSLEEALVSNTTSSVTHVLY